MCLLGADTIFSFLAVTGPYQPNILMQYQYLSNNAYIIFDMPKIHNKFFSFVGKDEIWSQFPLEIYKNDEI